MSKIIKLDMVFDTATAPDFGSIRKTRDGDLTILADDISKLNSVLTKTVCAPLAESPFSVVSGDLCYVADWKTEETAKAYMYEGSTDTWYEVI